MRRPEIARSVKDRRGKRIFPRVTLDEIRRLNRLIPLRVTESVTARSDKPAIAVLNRFLGAEWREEHIENSTRGFLRFDNTSPQTRERQRMRRIMLAEMLYNLQAIRGFRSLVAKLHSGEVESTYGALEIGRLIWAQALDRNILFRFVPESGTPSKKAKRNYDLSIKFSDGTAVRAETKCKLEETAITLRTLDQTISKAKSQLPQRVPCIVFVKIPRPWIEDEAFVRKIFSLVDRSMVRSPWVVSIKLYTVNVLHEEDTLGANTGEMVAVHERTNPKHRFRKYRNRDWHMFPTTPTPLPPPRTNYNGMPTSWQRLIVGDTNV